jgi:hypothetical protein
MTTDGHAEIQSNISGRLSTFNFHIYMKIDLGKERNGFGEGISHSSLNNPISRICCIGMFV